MNPRRRRRRSNPRQRITVDSIMRDFLQPAALGAVGAIANDALFTYLPLPAQLKTPGMMRYASKGLSAVLMSWLASFVLTQKAATQLGVGALTCLTAEVARDFILTNIPAIAPVAVEGMGLYTGGVMPGQLGYYNPAIPAGGGVNEMGVYVRGRETKMLPSLATTDTPGVGHMPDGYNYG